MDTKMRDFIKLSLTLLIIMEAVSTAIADDASSAPDSNLAQAKTFKAPQPLLVNELKAIQSVSHAVLIAGATHVTYPEQEAARQTMLDLYQQLNQIVEPALQQSKTLGLISTPVQINNPTTLTLQNSLPTEGTATGTINGKSFTSKVTISNVLPSTPNGIKAKVNSFAEKSVNTGAALVANDASSDFQQKINTLKVQLQQQLQARPLTQSSIQVSSTATTGNGEPTARLHHLPQRMSELQVELLGLIESPDRVDLSKLQAFRDRIRPKTGVDLLKEQAAQHPEQGDPLLNPTPTFSTITHHVTEQK